MVLDAATLMLADFYNCMTSFMVAQTIPLTIAVWMLKQLRDGKTQLPDYMARVRYMALAYCIMTEVTNFMMVIRTSEGTRISRQFYRFLTDVGLLMFMCNTLRSSRTIAMKTPYWWLKDFEKYITITMMVFNFGFMIGQEAFPIGMFNVVQHSWRLIYGVVFIILSTISLVDVYLSLHEQMADGDMLSEGTKEMRTTMTKMILLIVAFLLWSGRYAYKIHKDSKKYAPAGSIYKPVVFNFDYAKCISMFRSDYYVKVLIFLVLVWHTYVPDVTVLATMRGSSTNKPARSGQSRV
eukprot:51898_1